MVKFENLPSLFIRLGLGFVFTYAAASMSLSPENYAHYVPGVLLNFMSAELFLNIFAVYEVILSLWLLVGKWQFISSIMSTATLFAITFFNLDSFNIVFRNVGIIFASLALVTMNWLKTQASSSNVTNPQPPVAPITPASSPESIPNTTENR